MLTALKNLFSKKTHYVSDIDRFLNNWDNSHPKSKSQEEEFKKYQRVYKLRGPQ